VGDQYAVGAMSALNRVDLSSIDSFRTLGRTFDQATRTISLHYALGEAHPFVESITFETPPHPDVAPDFDGLDRALVHLQIAAGTSYYKAAAPPLVLVEATGLTPQELEFHRRLYDDGLREFAVANGLEVPLRVEIRPGLGTAETWNGLATSDRPRGLVVPIGGGKDSMVLIEAVKHLKPRLLAVNPHPLVLELAAQTGLELIVVRRRLSPNLFELNRMGAMNGHVPITAIVSLIAAAASFIYGYDAIAMAVERSASEETRMQDGVPVNHQFSKSLEFERLLQSLVSASVDPGLSYGSALRPYSELAIARSFAGMAEYHGSFCSCNTVFRQTAPSTARWCGNCPKCRFVALMLAPFMEPEALATIIGVDLFAEPSQIPGFAALMSDEDKPFECVGEKRESAAAMRMLTGLPRWQTKPVVAALGGQAAGLVTDQEVTELLTPDPDTAYPDAGIADDVEQMLTEPS
jgi:hypothetical protein